MVHPTAFFNLVLMIELDLSHNNIRWVKAMDICCIYTAGLQGYVFIKDSNSAISNTLELTNG